MIVICDAVENYMFLRDSQPVKLFCEVGKLPRIVCFTVFLTGAR